MGVGKISYVREKEWAGDGLPRGVMRHLRWGCTHELGTALDHRDSGPEEEMGMCTAVR